MDVKTKTGTDRPSTPAYEEKVAIKCCKDIKIQRHTQQLMQVYQYLFSHPATMKEVDNALGIMRENVCRHVATLRKNDSLYVVAKRHCRITKHMATVWTTNPELAPAPDASQLKIF